MTQAQLAAELKVDVATVQGWESGRRPLTALRSSDLVRLRKKLTTLGALPCWTTLLNEAVEADLIIGDVIDAGGLQVDPARHTLANSVHRRDLTNMITWPFTGIMPTKLGRLTQPARRRRGPVADRPTLSPPDRARFFDHLLVTVDANEDVDTALLRRQAVYLLGFDHRPSVEEWLDSEQQRALNSAEKIDHVPSWVAVRSSALALARSGNREPLQRFVQTALGNDKQERANLNYWAYWVGEIEDTQCDDSFMLGTDPQSWDGVRVLTHLLHRLYPSTDHLELNIHSLWTLLLNRPALLEPYPGLRTLAHTQIERASEDDDLTPQARRELANLSYAVHLSSR